MEKLSIHKNEQSLGTSKAAYDSVLCAFMKKILPNRQPGMVGDETRTHAFLLESQTILCRLGCLLNCTLQLLGKRTLTL